MGIRSDKEIYQALEKRLRETPKPITCVDLMDDPEFRATAMAEYGKDVRVATNKVSDALGLMWLRNLLVRFPAPKETNSLVRYAYIWDKGRDTIQALPVLPRLLQRLASQYLKWTAAFKSNSTSLWCSCDRNDLLIP